MRPMGSVPPSDLAGVFAIVELVNNLVRDPGAVGVVVDPIRAAYDDLVAARDASESRLRDAEQAERRAAAAAERAAKDTVDAEIRQDAARAGEAVLRGRIADVETLEAGVEVREADIARAGEMLAAQIKAVERQARDADQEHIKRMSALSSREGALAQLQASLEERLAEATAVKAEYQAKLNTIKALAGAEDKA